MCPDVTNHADGVARTVTTGPIFCERELGGVQPRWRTSNELLQDFAHDAEQRLHVARLADNDADPARTTMTLGVERSRVKDHARDAVCCKKLFCQRYAVTITEIDVEHRYREASFQTPHCSARDRPGYRITRAAKQTTQHARSDGLVFNDQNLGGSGHDPRGYRLTSSPSLDATALYNRVARQHYQLLFMTLRSVRNLVPLRFGREVRRRRKALGITLEQLAERSGLTPNYIGTVENGRRDPSLSTISALARGLGVPTGELIGGVGEMSSEALEAARLFDSAAPEVQVALLQLLRSVARRRR